MLNNYGFESELPNSILFNLNEIQSLGLIKEDMAKKLIRTRVIESIKIGNKHHVPRYELVRYLEKEEETQSLEDVIPKSILFNLKEIESCGIIKVDMLKKLIQKKELEPTLIGNRLHIARYVLINYLNTNTTKRIRSEVMNV